MKEEKTYNLPRGDFKKKLSLNTTHKNIIRLRPPEIFEKTLAVPAAVFAFNSSFPGNGILLHLHMIQEIAEKHSGKLLMVFGHTDKTGKEVYNKHLSDRRAKALMALLTNDRKSFDQISSEEDWDLRIYQTMLRGIGCNPGAIDGVDGEMTKAAIKAFQREYNEGFYHDSLTNLAIDGVPIDGILAKKTKAAIRDAYLALHSPKITISRFVSIPFAGCSEFNPISNKSELNRRAVVAVVSPSSSVLKEIPCRMGDIAACLIDDKGKMRCSFYRRCIQEDTKELDIPRFFDFQWLREESGEAHLSALTYIPDGTSAKFTIYKCDQPLPLPPPNSAGGGTRPSFKNQLGTVDGKISGGVCYARWKPPKDYDPFDYDCWMVDLDIDVEIYTDTDEEELDDSDPGSPNSLFDKQSIEPPVFCIDAGGHWGFSHPPGKLLNRVRFVDDPSATGVALRGDGGIISFTANEGKVDIDDNTAIISLVLSEKEPDFEEA
jgi:hypothetical protein